MEVDLDMNSNRVINLAEPAEENDAARLKDVQNAIAGDTTANLISFTPYGDITSDTVQGAVQEVEDNIQSIEDSAGTLTVSSSTGTQTLTEALNDRAIILESDLTVNIPTDYADWQQALDGTANYISNGFKIVVNLESGHTIPVGLLVKNRDCSHYEITSADATVLLDGAFTPITGEDSVVDSYNGAVIMAVNSNMPRLSILIDSNDVAATGIGYAITNRSSAKVDTDCGVINAGTMGFLATRGSTVDASGSNFSGANWGNRVTTNSKLNAPTANFSGAKNANTPLVDVSCLDVSRGSLVNITGASGDLTNLSGSANKGLAVRRSKVSAQFIDVSGAADQGINAIFNSQVLCDDSNASGCVTGLFVDRGSQVSGVNFNADNCTGDSIVFGSGSQGTIDGASAINSGIDALTVEAGSTVDANGFTGTGATDDGVVASSGAYVNVRGADVSGAGNRGIIADSGAHVCARNTNAQKGGSPSTSDVVIFNGSIVAFNGGTGGISVTANTISGDGIIFQ